MKFTLSWLKEHLEIDAPLKEITDGLTMIGLELEGVEDRAAALKGFVTAKVTAAERHPDADKLQLCTVDTGSETFQVVCGAPNARAGMTGVFAREGMYIPGIDVTLKKAKIRGVESRGMLLSEREMGLSDDHQGIVDLPEGTPIGEEAAAIMGLGDPIIEIAITPNRGDCLGVRGVARDLAAAGIGILKPLDATPVPAAFDSPVGVTLDFDEAHRDACPYFVGRMVRGVKNGASPQWVQDKLTAVGLRPISALVDITNLMTIEYGRPMHVFDLAKCDGGIRPRMAKDGEKLLALDGKEYELDAEMTVIADQSRAEAIAGIMGGEESGCTETTTDVFIETAYFDAVRTAMTGRKLNLQSDARYRFERGVDPELMIDATEIATRWMLDWCGGEASNIIVAGEKPVTSKTIAYRPNRVASLGGVVVDESEQERILTVLGFGIDKGAETWTVTSPAWRHDIVGEACVVEEILRLHGYDNIPAVALERTTDLPEAAWLPTQARHVAARRLLAQRGLREVVTYSFLPEGHAELFGGVDDSLRLVNPISADLNVMRPSILPNLIAAAARNADRGFRDADLFEVGPQFRDDTPEGQDVMATGLRSGRTGHRNWANPPRGVDAFDAKADALAVLAAVGAPVDKLQVSTDAPGWYHPGRSGCLRLGPNVLATFGEMHPKVLKALGLKAAAAGYEVFLDRVPFPKKKAATTRPRLDLSAFQPVERDFAFVVDTDVKAGDLMRAVRGADKVLITDVRVFDQFIGGNLGDDKKSLAVNIVLQPTEKTLTDQDLETVAAKVVAAVEKATGGALRG
ncbi:phenylalanine--tRNA ligase subunit beta [Magnetospira sp. QH-2]|uniref:phenylalanine--tRNA ligase subunit beta n=1 Tax=Magnetospira sp. (strain QH-2) TaxID=1288970 RepID=UPI0003E810C5|nr:phenylalanine--tRNA ligase subunit beta [Magnetospira sp. QH-2]CCQ72707.1 Phenylalanyl-tRNA synthetase beta chain (Phenylalanine--tRNA ligase beta chain) [Magnetospira sp. QH-2]